MIVSTYPPDMSNKLQNGNTTRPARWRPDQPYDGLPRLPPAAELETKAVLKRCIGARAALGELKQAVDLIAGPEMLMNTLPLLEAQASSEIENVVTTADELYRHAQAREVVDPAVKEALRYREALLEAARGRGGRPLGTRLAELICSRIKGVEMGVRKVPGTALAKLGSWEVVYTPPQGEALLRELLADWERFMHGEAGGLDPLVRLAVAHYQFEAIHPFTDGNGRTGRVLNSLLLVERGLLPMPVLYLSRYLMAHKPEYDAGLLAVTREGAWEEWILFMVRGVEETALWTNAKIGGLRELAAHTSEYVRGALPKIYSRELVDVLFMHPYCRIPNLTEQGIAKRQTASRYLKALVEIGVLREHAAGREKLFEHPKLVRLLTADSNEFARYP